MLLFRRFCTQHNVDFIHMGERIRGSLDQRERGPSDKAQKQDRSAERTG